MIQAASNSGAGRVRQGARGRPAPIEYFRDALFALFGGELFDQVQVLVDERPVCPELHTVLETWLLAREYGHPACAQWLDRVEAFWRSNLPGTAHLDLLLNIIRQLSDPDGPSSPAELTRWRDMLGHPLAFVSSVEEFGPMVRVELQIWRGAPERDYRALWPRIEEATRPLRDLRIPAPRPARGNRSGRMLRPCRDLLWTWQRATSLRSLESIAEEWQQITTGWATSSEPDPIGLARAAWAEWRDAGGDIEIETADVVRKAIGSVRRRLQVGGMANSLDAS